MKKHSFLLFTILMTIVIAFCIADTVKGQNDRKLSLNNKYEKEMERKYIKEIRDELSDMGYEYAGVSLTKVINEEQDKIYTLSIHHKRIDKMNEEERQALIEQLSEIKLLESEYQIDTKILEYNC